MLCSWETKNITFGKAIHTTQGTLDYIHFDMWVPSRVPSKGGASYFDTFIDDLSWKVWVYMLKQKSEVFKVFHQWKALVENQMGKKIKRLRIDNGMNFFHLSLMIFLETRASNRMSHAIKNVLGPEVDKISKILIKTLNAMEFIELDIQNI